MINFYYSNLFKIIIQHNLSKTPNIMVDSKTVVIEEFKVSTKR